MMTEAQLNDILPALPSVLDFEPAREPQIRNGVILSDRFWVVNPVTDAVIGDSRSVHRTANFRTMWDNLREGLALANIDTSNAQVDFSTIAEGAAFSAKIILNKYDFEKKLGEAAKMQMNVRDSHDQSVKRQVEAMIYRLACLNGMIAPRERVGISQKHTTYSDPETVGKVAANFPVQLEQQAEMMAQMRQVKVFRDQVIRFFENHVATYHTRTGSKVNKKWLDKIVGIYDNYASIGDNAYRVYNTLTHISTHIEGRDGTDLERKRIRIETDIHAVMQSEAYQQMFMPEFALAA
jgi:hypothetical protein